MDILGLLCIFYVIVFIDLEVDVCVIINGFVWYDIMEFCILDFNDLGLVGWQVFVIFDGEIQFIFIDVIGYYEFNVLVMVGMIIVMVFLFNWIDCVFIVSVNFIEG